MQDSESENDSQTSPSTSSSQNIIRTIPEILPPEYSLNIPFTQTGQANLGDGKSPEASALGQHNIIPGKEPLRLIPTTILSPENISARFIPSSVYVNKVVIGIPHASSGSSSSDQNCFSCCPGCSVSHSNKAASKEVQTSTKSSKGKSSGAMRYFRRKKSDGVQAALDTKRSDNVVHSHSCDAIHSSLVKPFSDLVLRDTQNEAIGSRTSDDNSNLTVPIRYHGTGSDYNVQTHFPLSIVPNSPAPSQETRTYHSFYVNPPPPRVPHRETVPFSGPGPPPPYSSLAPPPYSYVALDTHSSQYKCHPHNQHEAQTQWTTNSAQKDKNQMLSVQSPGCAGMERLGGGAGAAGGGDVTGGGKGKRRDIDDLTLREVNMILEYRARRERCVQNAEHLNCPPHIALPDGEGGPDKHLQLRVNYQQSELTRSTVQPPPNKSVMDVPEWAAAVPMCPGGATHKPLSPQKKDGIVQKAVKYLVKIGGGKASPEGEQGAPTHHREERRAPCVMVPLTRPPPPPHPPPT